VSLAMPTLMPVHGGREYIGVPSCGLRKRTPSSVTCASFRSDTIWKLSRCQRDIDENDVDDALHTLHYLLKTPTQPPVFVLGEISIAHTRQNVVRP